MAAIPNLDDLWQTTCLAYGLERPLEEVEIHVFRVIMRTSLDEVACTRSVIPANYNSDPIDTLSQIIEQWRDLEMEEQDHSWKLTMDYGGSGQNLVPPIKTCSTPYMF